MVCWAGALPVPLGAEFVCKDWITPETTFRRLVVMAREYLDKVNYPAKILDVSFFI